MASEDSSDLEHLQMLYPELVDRAMRSQEPVTEVRPVGDTREIYSTAHYDPATETCWRADIDHDPRWDGSPHVTFSKCNPTAEHEFVQKWSSLATGRLSGPQKLPEWESLFTVFNAALGLYHRECGDVE